MPTHIYACISHSRTCTTSSKVTMRYLYSHSFWQCTTKKENLQHFLSFQTGRPKSVCEKWRLESFRSSFISTYVPSCRENGSFAKTQCHFEVTRIRCWEVDKYGKPTGKKRPDIILPPRSRYNTEHDSTRTLQPITNDASARMFGYTRTGSTTENEIVETNPKTTKTRQPMSKVLLKQVAVSLRT